MTNVVPFISPENSYFQTVLAELTCEASLTPEQQDLVKFAIVEVAMAAIHDSEVQQEMFTLCEQLLDRESSEQSKSFKTAEHACPHCNTTMNACLSMSEDQEPPRHGDISVCGYCGEIMMFGENLELVPVPPEVIAEIDFVELAHAQRVVKQAQLLRENKDSE